MENIDPRAFAEVGRALLDPAWTGVRPKTATKYMSPKSTVRATVIGKRDKRDRRLYIAFAVGSPNYAERKFIKSCHAVGEVFPVKRVQLKFPPIKRVAPKRKARRR